MKKQEVARIQQEEAKIQQGVAEIQQEEGPAVKNSLLQSFEGFRPANSAALGAVPPVKQDHPKAFNWHKRKACEPCPTDGLHSALALLSGAHPASRLPISALIAARTLARPPAPTTTPGRGASPWGGLDPGPAAASAPSLFPEAPRLG